MTAYQSGEIVTRGFMAMFYAATIVATQSACSPPSTADVVGSRASRYDGVYSGVSTVTFGSAPLCGSDSNISFPITNGILDYKFGDYPLKFRVSEEGALTNAVSVGEYGRHTIQIDGKVSGEILETDNVVGSQWGGSQTHWCSYHWSLKKL